MPTGGDGTFLFAASRVRNQDKMVVGFNSDPNRSEGHLCLPKKFSSNIKAAIVNLQQVISHLFIVLFKFNHINVFREDLNG